MCAQATLCVCVHPVPTWQVRNSGNFATSNPLVCALYGGINFQIEHHLFPTLCHVHYAKVKPIVRQACAEFGSNHRGALRTLYPLVTRPYTSVC